MPYQYLLSRSAAVWYCLVLVSPFNTYNTVHCKTTNGYVQHFQTISKLFFFLTCNFYIPYQKYHFMTWFELCWGKTEVQPACCLLSPSPSEEITQRYHRRQSCQRAQTLRFSTVCRFLHQLRSISAQGITSRSVIMRKCFATKRIKSKLLLKARPDRIKVFNGIIFFL